MMMMMMMAMVCHQRELRMIPMTTKMRRRKNEKDDANDNNRMTCFRQFLLVLPMIFPCDLLISCIIEVALQYFAQLCCTAYYTDASEGFVSVPEWQCVGDCAVSGWRMDDWGWGTVT